MESEDGHVERILNHSRGVRREARELRNEIGAAARELRDKVDVTDSVREHPFRAIAFGLAAGYVLGGGLCSRPTRAILGFGVRAALLPIVKAQALSILAGEGPKTVSSS